MNIIHVDTEKGLRGGEKQLLYLIKYLKKEGIVNQKVACIKEEKLWKICKEIKVETIDLSGNQLKDLFILGNEGKWADIIHAHNAKGHNIAIYSKFIHRKKVIYTRRVDYIPKKNFLTKLKYKQTDKVISISNTIKNILERQNIKSEVIYSSVDVKLADKVNREKVKLIKSKFKTKYIIGNVGALTEQKNHFLFIDTAKILSSKLPDSTFIILGEGPLLKKLKNYAEFKNVQSKIKFLGFKKDIENFLKAMDVLVFTSKNEGLGSTILQAMLLKIPVVATQVGGIPEIVKNNETGLLVSPDNPTKVSEAILKIISDTELKNKIIDRAYKMVINNFTANKMAEKYLKIYESLIQKR